MAERTVEWERSGSREITRHTGFTDGLALKVSVRVLCYYMVASNKNNAEARNTILRLLGTDEA